MKLSKHFKLSEFERSETAKELNINNIANNYVIDRLIELCQTILEPIRYETGKLFVTSGYRSPKLNKAIGGSRSSQHMVGEAADIKSYDLSTFEIMIIAIEEDLPYHQLIDEFGSWVHVSIAPKGEQPRKQILKAVKENGKTKYLKMSKGDYAWRN